MILAVLGEAACYGVEVAAIERLIELFGDAPIGLCDVQGSPPVAAWDTPILRGLACYDEAQDQLQGDEVVGAIRNPR